MSNLIHKITKDGKIIYPATTTDAVVHPSLKAEVTKIFTEYNVTALFPTSGIDSSDTYNLAIAISTLSGKLEDAQKNPGVKVIFKNKDNQVESWKYTGISVDQFINTGYWVLEDILDEKNLPVVKSLKYVRGLNDEDSPVIISTTDLLSSLNSINKGYYSTEEELKEAWPTANLGDIAFVGNSYPYQIWRWNGESWVDTGETGGQSDVELGNYYNKEEIDNLFIQNGSGVPVLPSVPGENTTTWVDNEEVYTFKVGQFARVADPKSKTGYRFYQLYNIDESGKTKWQESNLEYQVTTLDTVPNESTLAWNNGLEEVPFEIGQQVRVDSGNATSDKVIYQLYDIKDGLAVWRLVGEDYSPVTLAEKPTGSTLTWTFGNIEIKFKIGQQVRVPNEEGDDYLFYQLYDIKDGLATWKEAGSGGSGSGSGGDEVFIGDVAPEPDSPVEIFIDTSINPEDIEVYTKQETNELIESPSFDSLPPSSQLNWTDSTGTYPFRIGQLIRVADRGETNGYKFYIAVKIEGSNVTWQEADRSSSGGGGISDAPSDGKKYVRSNASWVEETTIDTSNFATKDELSGKQDKGDYALKSDLTTFATKTEVNSLSSKITNIEYKTNKLTGSNTVYTLNNLPTNKGLIVANLSSATSLSVSSGMEVGQSITVICNPSSNFTQALPNAGSYVSMDGDSIEVKSGTLFEINIYCYSSGKYSLSSKIQTK